MKLLFTQSAIPFILEALDIKTNIPHDKIGAFYNGKIYGKDLLSIINLGDDLKTNSALAQPGRAPSLHVG